jgi:hypothetical protein
MPRVDVKTFAATGTGDGSISLTVLGGKSERYELVLSPEDAKKLAAELLAEAENLPSALGV